MPEEHKLPIKDLPRTRSERFVSIYANHTEALPSFYELDLIFNRIGKGVDGVIVEEVAEVILTWEHAVRVRDLLNRMVETYEGKQGHIRILKDEEAPGSEEVPPPAPQ
jgi:hypothetical protein